MVDRMVNNQNRTQRYKTISTKLASLSKEQLISLLREGQSMHKGIGGSSHLIAIDNIPIFVKKIPLSDLELQSEHYRSTANIYHLPLYYQYGVGSAGFCTWRELETHIVTTDWIISGQCPNFPILYHWRIMPNGPDDINTDYWGNLDQYCQYWENSEAIRHRVKSIVDSKSHITLFLEYVPKNLDTWLDEEFKKGQEASDAAIQFVEKDLNLTNHFMNNHGLIHFDVHFQNILTDGQLLYFSDFGLALSTQFDLDDDERAFIKKHYNYDQACAAVNLLHSITTTQYGKDNWEIKLKEFVRNQENKCSIYQRTIVKKYASIALTMDKFFQKLQKESKKTIYPSEEIDQMLSAINIE